MLKQIQDRLGMSTEGQSLGLGHGPEDGKGHGHTHGSIDPTIATTTKGIWAIKWSFIVLAITSALQLVVVEISGSVALLADTIHNVGDAVTAIPLWIAFVLGPQKWPTSLFLAVSTLNYAWKMLAAIALIPLLYLMRRWITAYLGASRARELREQAAS